MRRAPNQSPEPTAVGACRSAVAVTSRVGGGSAFFVRHHSRFMWEEHPEYQKSQMRLIGIGVALLVAIYIVFAVSKP